MPLPPGLAGYHVGRQQQGQEQARQIHGLSALQNMMAQQQQMQQSEQVRGILSQAPSLEAAIPMLMKAGPAGIQAAGSLAQLQKQTADAKASSEKAAFFSPENTQQYREGGQPGHPDITLPPELSGPVAPARAAVPGKMNFDRLLQDAASRNMVQPETYANHLAQREQAKASMEQTAQSRRDTLSTQLQIARERSEDQSLSRAENNKARMDMIRLTASLRPAPAQTPLESVVGPDGKPILVPRADAIGRTPAGKGAAERAMPPSGIKNLLENQENLRRAEQALALSQGKTVNGAVGDKNATGLKGFLSSVEVGDVALQKLDPKGVPTRAAIADLGSMIIHDRSGAAVTAAEYPRLRPFIPKATDDNKTIQAKLNRFVTEYRNIQKETTDFYQESGYKVPSGSLRPPPAVTSGPPPPPGFTPD